MIEKIISLITIAREGLMIVFSGMLGGIASHLYGVSKGKEGSFKMFLINAYMGGFVGSCIGYLTGSHIMSALSGVFAFTIIEKIDKVIPMIIDKQLKDKNLIDKNSQNENNGNNTGV